MEEIALRFSLTEYTSMIVIQYLFICRAALGRVCLKLVVVMGITWAADVISWAVGGPNYLWYVTDIINTLQGVFIFIVVGCQPQVNIHIVYL